MGVPRFFKVFISTLRYPDIILRYVPDSISTLALDANGILHNCAQTCYAYGEGKSDVRAAYVASTAPEVLEKEYHLLVSNKILEVVTQVRPTELLILAIDGVCPLAKIKQQRQRRYRAAMEQASGSSFDSNAITTGTDFMMRLDRYLTKWIKEAQLSLPPTVIYSNHLVRGEGEHKIMDIYRARRDLQHRSKSHAIYGLDADLMLLAMLAPIHNAYLVREDVTEVVNIEALKNALHDRQMMNYRSPVAIVDFSVLMSFVGNDFLPSVVSTLDMAESLRMMMSVYRRVRLPLTTSQRQLHWENLSIYLKELATQEERMLLSLSYKPQFYPLQIVKDNADVSHATRHTIDMEALRMQWYNYILSPPPNDQLAVFEKLMPAQQPLFGLEAHNFNDMLTKYLVGVAWMLRYYTRGPTAINSSYYYPYFHAPLFNELAEMSTHLNQSFYDELPDNYHFSIPHQLLSVLPPKSLNLMPTMLRHYVTEPFSSIRDLFPSTFFVDTEGSKHGNALVPFVQPDRILEAIDSIVFNDAQRKYYFEEGKELVLIRVTAPIRESSKVAPVIGGGVVDVRRRPSSPLGSPTKTWDRVMPGYSTRGTEARGYRR